MSKISRLYVTLGNGFSIDLIKRLKVDDKIDLINLFSKGTSVCWPFTNESFLSYKHCKSLWQLGARSTVKSDYANKLIEDIITCANVYNYSMTQHEDFPKQELIKENTYLNAYAELTIYLRRLMIYYNDLVNDCELKEVKVPFINYLKKIYDKYEEIIIVTYNYDIWLERLLKLNSIDFVISGFEEDSSHKVKIIKPHGSISFSYKSKIQNKKINISKYYEESYSEETDQFEIKYDGLTNDYPLVNAIIPPAGDSNRFNLGWITTLRKYISDKFEKADSKDKLIIFGLSYWHVDRMELDEIITKIHPNSDVCLINPNPPSSFEAVLTSLFNNYTHFASSDLLESNFN